MPYLYLSYKPTIKVSHIITSTSKTYENTDTNICLQLGLIRFSKPEIPGVCRISFGCPGCRYINHTRAMGGIEKSKIYKFLKYYMVREICFGEEVAMKIWSLGILIVCFSLVP